MKINGYKLNYTITSNDCRVVDDAYGVLGGLTPSKKNDRWVARRAFTNSEAKLEIIYETQSWFNYKFVKLALDVIVKVLTYKYRT